MGGGQGQAQGGEDTRDPQQKIFDELRELVLKINNEANVTEQGKLINTFSQKLDEALSNGFDCFKEFKADGFIKNTAVQFVTNKSNNQQFIKTFFKKILPTIKRNEDQWKEIFRSIEFSLNIEAIKAFFSVVKDTGNANIIDEKASVISRNLTQYYVTDSMSRDKSTQNEVILEQFGKVKAILEFFLNEDNIKGETRSNIKTYLNKTKEAISTQKKLPQKIVPQPSLPPVGAGVTHFSAAKPASAKPTLPLQARQAQPIQPHVAVPTPLQRNQLLQHHFGTEHTASPVATSAPAGPALSLQSTQDQPTGTMVLAKIIECLTRRSRSKQPNTNFLE